MSDNTVSDNPSHNGRFLTHGEEVQGAPRFVLIVWNDHSKFCEDDSFRSAEVSSVLRPVERVTAGFIIRDEPEYIHLASTLAWTIGHLSHERVILKAAIVSMQEYEYTLPTLSTEKGGWLNNSNRRTTPQGAMTTSSQTETEQKQQSS